MPSGAARAHTSEPPSPKHPAPAPVANDTAPLELTARAVLMGCALGAVLSAANVYTGLKTSFLDGGNITASVLAYALFAAFGSARRPYSRLENNLTQTIAASAAYMSMVAGVAGPIPALMLTGRTVPAWAIVGWGIALGGFGVVIAMLLRPQLIRAEGLPFPTGTATAEVIEAMAVHHGAASRRARALLGGALAAALVTFLRDGPPALIPGDLLLPGAILGIPLASLSVGVSVSPLLFATGMLVGARVGLSMLLGSAIAWLLIAPLLVRASVVGAAEHEALVGWLMWPGAGLVLSSSLTGVALEWRALWRGVIDLRALASGKRPEEVKGRRFTVLPLVALALLASGVVLAIGSVVLGLGPVVSVLALGLALLLASVVARSAGETDIAPVGDMGGLTQIVFGTASASTSVACGSIVSGAAAQTAATLWAYKCGDRLGASVRRQTAGQLLGVLVGALVVVPVYGVLTRAYPIGSPQLPAPAALSWKATAEAVQGGVAALPSHATSAAALAIALGVALSLLARTRAARWLPSPTALGMGFLLPPAPCATLCLGALLLLVAQRRDPSRSEELVGSIAGGVIAGESVFAVLLAALVAAGVI